MIIEYNDKYLDDVKDLLVELEKYILSIDKDNLDQLHPKYREKKAIIDLEEGARITAQIVDCKYDELKIGLGVEAVFRKLYKSGEKGIIHYGTKFRLKL